MSRRALELLSHRLRQAALAVERGHVGLARRLLQTAMAMMDEGIRKGYFTQADQASDKIRR